MVSVARFHLAYALVVTRDGDSPSTGSGWFNYGCSHLFRQRQRSPSRHLWRVGVQRLVGFYFSSAVLGFAFPNRIRVVRDLCFSVVEGP